MLPNTYAKLFIKKYAQEVGLDVEEILALYDRKAPREEPAKLPPPPAHRTRNFQPVIFIAVGVFIVALLIWQINQQNEPGTASPLDATLSSPQMVTQQPPSQSTSLKIVQETQTVGQNEATSPQETTDITTPTAASNTSTSSETDATPEPTQSSESLLATSQPVTPSTETGSLPNTQTEPLQLETEMTAPQSASLAEEIQPPETETVTEQVATDVVSPSSVTQNQTSEGLTAEEQTPNETTAATITKPLPVQIAPGNPIILSGIVQETTQIIVKADGRTLFDGELQTGSRPRWMARESLELTLTNQKAIALSLQNQPLQFDNITTQAIQVGINRTQINISPSKQ